MAGAEIANLKGNWVSGDLVIEDLSGNDVITISTGGGIFLYSDLTISGGRLAFNGQATNTVTASATLTASGSGVVQLVTASDVILTLPGAASTGKTIVYTVQSTLTTAGQVVVITCTGEVMTGGGFGNSGANIAANTAATHIDGDLLQIVNTVGSTSWSVVGMVGTWASTT